MADNVPTHIMRPPRISSVELGMFSLGSEGSDGPVSEKTVEEIQRLTQAINNVFAPRKFEDLEKMMRLSPYRSKNLLRRVINVGTSQQQKLPFAQRRINLVKSLITKRDFDLQMEAISLLHNAGDDIKEQFEPNILKMIDKVVSMPYGPIWRSTYAMFDLLKPETREDVLTHLWESGNSLHLKIAVEYLRSLDSPTQIRCIIRMLKNPEIGPYYAAIDLVLGLNPEERVRVGRWILSNPPRADFDQTGFNVLRKFSDAEQCELLSEIFEVAEVYKRSDWADAYEDLMFMSPGVHKALAFEMCENPESLRPDILNNWITRMSPQDQFDVFEKLLDDDGFDFTELIEKQTPYFTPENRRQIGVRLLTTDDPYRQSVGLGFLHDMPAEEILQLEQHIVRYIKSAPATTHRFHSLRKEFQKFDSSSRGHLATYLFQCASSEDAIFHSMRFAQGLDARERTVFAAQNEARLAQLLDEKPDLAVVKLLCCLPPEQLSAHQEKLTHYVQDLSASGSLHNQILALEINLTIDNEIYVDPGLVRSALSSDDAILQSDAIDLTRHLRPKFQEELAPDIDIAIKRMLTSNNEFAELSAVEYIAQLPENQQTPFHDDAVQLFLSQVGRSGRIDKELVFATLHVLPAEMQIEMLRSLSPTHQRQCEREVIETIEGLPADVAIGFVADHLYDKKSSFMESNSWNIIRTMPPELVLPIMLDAIKTSEDITFSAGRTAFISRISEVISEMPADKKSLVQNALLNHISDPTKSVLHERASDAVEKFDKDGSDTFILPASSEASVRVIEKDTAHTWVNAYLAADKWKEKGFTYVPVEPILDISSEGGQLVSVTTVNLRGRSLAQSTLFLSLYSPEVQTQVKEMVETIHTTMNEMGMAHGHAHAGNFVIVPETDSTGKVDFEEAPRVYVIDFDAALFKPGAPLLDASHSSTPSQTTDSFSR